jgi:hypothetical protein
MKGFPILSVKRPKRPPRVTDATLRDFSGGYRVTENESTLKSKYAPVLKNMFTDDDQSQVLRFGTKEFATCSDDIINHEYYRQRIVNVLSSGEIQTCDSDGNVVTIWNTTIAAALPGSPSGWTSGITHADFTEFRGEMIVTNGIDKPLLIDDSFAVTYLQDIPTGNNVNTPIAKYTTTVSNFCVMAGIPSNDTLIYISASGASGTWIGDPAPNDATSLDVGAYTGQASSDIKGLGSFKNYLLIFFENFLIIFQLGTFNDSGTHVPEVIDTYENLGTTNHKTLFATKEDLIFTSNEGIISAKKNIFGGTLTTANASDNLGKEYPASLGLVTSGEQDCFCINDPLSKTSFFSFKKSDDTFVTYAMRYKKDFKEISWAVIEGWSFTSACTSEKGRVFFAQEDKIYQYGNEVFDGENYYADFITDISDGVDIEFDWELPWLDAGNRAKSKILKKITFETTGSARFTLQCFVNNFYKDTEGTYTPVAEMEFIAGTAGGYGNNAEGYGAEEYGGGRRANDERFFGIPVKFKILKLRFVGATKSPLRIVSITMLYAKGNYTV